MGRACSQSWLWQGGQVNSLIQCRDLSEIAGAVDCYRFGRIRRAPRLWSALVAARQVPDTSSGFCSQSANEGIGRIICLMLKLTLGGAGLTVERMR